MAVRHGILHRHRVVEDTAPADEEQVYDEQTGQVVTEDRPAGGFWRRRRVRDDVAADDVAADDAVDDTADGTVTTGRRVVDRPAADRVVDDDTVRAPVVAREPVVVEERPGWAHVSAAATVGLILGVVAMCATLTGLLAPEGFAVGIIGALVSMAGLVGASRRGVTGHSVALIGLLASAGAIVLSVMAMTGHFAWPNSHTNEVARLHDWLVSHWSWLRHWS